MYIINLNIKIVNGIYEVNTIYSHLLFGFGIVGFG